jgi:hypothetical protein
MMSNECCICLEEIKDNHKLLCTHSYHKICIDKWFESNQSCPICRNIEVIKKNPNTVYWLDAISDHAQYQKAVSVTFEVGGSAIDKQFGTWFDLWDEMTLHGNKTNSKKI